MMMLALARIETGVRNLDALLHGGLPKGSVLIVAGSPGAGKTILAQQICFHHASANQRVVFFSTLSEPTAKTLLYLSQFSFFDREKVFMHKIAEPPSVRAKVFQLATIVQNVGAVGLLATDIPYGANQLSRSGVEETVVDGVILLSATEEDMNRQRYVEVYKLRNTAHVTGRHKMTIGAGGITIAKARRQS
jgi:circadian clock protein KaiC